MKRIITILLVLAFLNLSVNVQPPRAGEPRNPVLAGLVLLIGAGAAYFTIYVLTHYPQKEVHTMVLEKRTPPDWTWTPVATNVIYMETGRFYEAFRAWAQTNRVSEFYRVIEIPNIPGYEPESAPESIYQPVPQPHVIVQ